MSYQLQNISVIREELKNLRTAIKNLKYQFVSQFGKLTKQIDDIAKILLDRKDNSHSFQTDLIHGNEIIKDDFTKLRIIGKISSTHLHKNGTPRQGSVSVFSQGCLEIGKNVFNNPSHSLEGLDEFSHVWILFIFHQNSGRGTSAKVCPPRLNGSKVGIFASRSPHRPNCIGITLAKLDSVIENQIFISGIDILDGTPVIDIKPYIPMYDCPFTSVKEFQNEIQENTTGILNSTDNMLSLKQKNNKDDSVKSAPNLTAKNVIENQELNNINEDVVKYPLWIKNSTKLDVIFNSIADKDIEKFSTEQENKNFRLKYLKSSVELRHAITNVLLEDPRSVYRRQKCMDRLYYFQVDSAHVTACFFDSVAEVLRVNPIKTS